MSVAALPNRSGALHGDRDVLAERSAREVGLLFKVST